MYIRNLALATASSLVIASGSAVARDYVHVAGSSTVLPYASIVAEAFGENFDFPTPVVESGGSGAGRKRMCEGVGTNTTDIANSSSLMKEEEGIKCKANIGEYTKVQIGYDGIVFASRLETKGFEDLAPAHIYLAISGTKHGTREVFDKKVMVAGCKKAGTHKYLMDSGLTKKEADKDCMKVRTDGVSVDIDGDYTETLASLASNKEGIGVFGLSFLLNNTDTIYASKVNGVTPSTETIASGEYPISRPLQFYVKNAHIGQIPGLKEYIQFFVSDEIAGPDGPLAEYGLVSDPELAKTQAMVDGL
ncbi:MAG: phosphonate ABC transporter substrate-binding protein [Rhodobacterales bacterium]|nr:phosphonate ABC transporter substrate-binding protein [Rhodobacterales bacterium]